MTTDRKIIYGIVVSLIYLTLFVFPNWYNRQVGKFKDPPRIVRFKMPMTGMPAAVLTDSGGIYTFSPRFPARVKYGIVRWQVDGPSKTQILWRLESKHKIPFVQAYDEMGKPIPEPTPQGH